MSPARWKRSCGRSRRATRRLRGHEDELDVRAAARLELELLADGRLHALLRARLSSVRSTCMMAVAEVLVARRVRRLAEHVTAARAQLLVEGGGARGAPVAFGRDHHAAAATAKR
jgi:hypothetical protein